MNIPKKLHIGGHDFKVEIKKMEQGEAGQCSYNKNIITIDSDLAQSQREATLFHEIFHAINSEFHSSLMGHAWMESLSQQLYQVLKDNKMLK